MQRDSISGTFTVAALLCVVCSVLVSGAAVGLRPFQDTNKALFQKKNILIAAGISDPEKTIDELFANIESHIVDLENGEYYEGDLVDPVNYDQKAAAKNPELSQEIDSDKDIAGIKRREKYSRVYLVKNGTAIEKVILPVYGK